MCIYGYIHTDMHIPGWVYMPIYIHIHIGTHTHMHIYKHSYQYIAFISIYDIQIRTYIHACIDYSIYT